MLNSVRNWLRAPTFEDPTRDLIARLLNTILLTLLGSCVVFTLTLLIGNEVTLNLWLWVMFALSVFFGVLLVVMRYGYIQLTSILLVVVVYGVVTLGVYTTGTINSPVTATYFILLLLATLLVNGRMTLLMTIIVGGTLAGLMRAEQAGLLWYVREYPPVTLADWLVWVTVFFVVCALLILANQVINTALQQATATSAELATSNKALATIRESLEDLVEERTQAAEDAMRQSEASQQAMARQVWLSTGLAQLARTVRGEQNLQLLAQNVMKMLCSYLEASVGSLFLMEDGVLSLAGGYAYAPETPPRFKMGEGIIGQAAASRRPLFLNDLAEAELTILSGLGGKKPTHLAVFPLLFEDTVIGVIEIGRWSAFTRIQQQFIGQVLESIAIAFHTARVRMQINELLQKTQQQAAELQAQEEELRASNEALATQAHELRTNQTTAADKTAAQR